MKTAHAIPAILAIFSTIGCSAARSETYEWSDGPKAENKGCEVAVQGWWEHTDRIHVRVEIRNLTDRDVIFSDGKWVAAQAAGETADGRATVQKIDPMSEGVTFLEDVPITGDFTVRGHSSELIDVTFPLAKKLASTDAPWTLDLNGHWSFGDAMAIEIPIAGGGAKATAAEPAANLQAPSHG
jgi:hypothetical protein